MLMPYRFRHVASVAALLLAVSWSGAGAQARPARDTVVVTPGAQYRAGGLHRFFFGTRYRALWTTPIAVPVLDLAHYAGGLKPTRKGGGQQTKSLRFTGGDGREYAFRSVFKDPSAVLPDELKNTFAASVLKDQMSSGHPAGPLVVASLLKSAGVLHPTPVLFVMPDDPALGEFRKEFAGMLGMIEERPKEMGDEESSFAGASDIVSTDDLLKRLDDEPATRVDARAFLLARLTDVFLGDWDRHSDQWRWALVGPEGQQRWLPIPRDRDQAFSRFDGFILDQARRASPQLLDFGPSYGNLIGATWNGRNLDRRFLTGLERPAWDSTAALLKSRLTDQAITDAVAELPPAFRPIDGPRLGAALRTRRDHLGEMAERYYRLLAHEVDVYATDKPDTATVTRRADGTTDVTLAHKGTAYFRRRFAPGETREIRLFLQGGADHLIVEGRGKSSPTVRVIGGGGDDRYTVGPHEGGIKLYDDRGQNAAEGAGINTKRWRWRPDSLHPKELPPRDWGRKTILLLNAGYGPDADVIIGYAGHTDWYGFRRVPYATRVNYRAEYATGLTNGRVGLGVTRQFENSHGFFELDGLGSGIETLRWYGLGNETVASGPASFYRLTQIEVAGGASLGFRFGKRNRVSFGPVVRWSDTDLNSDHNRNRFIATDRPYGTGRFGMGGLRAALLVDTRDHPAFATRGVRLSLEASGYPGWWDAVKPVGRAQAEGSLALAPHGSWQPSLTLMGGGVKTWGTVPFFVAPTLGGSRTLRGFRPDRFAGDAALYGSAELRVPLTRITFFVPGQQGVFGFADGGRVYVRGESSDTWHATTGGGVWLSFLGRDNVVYAGVGAPTKGNEGTRFLLGFGFPH
jgi:surface antigen Omp85-like protein